jgi:hypothetical protein
MVSELEIQRHLALYLNGKIQLHEFEDWFAPVMWDIDESEERVREMAGEIHILIAEFARGDRSEDSLREGLTRACQSLASTRVE